MKAFPSHGTMGEVVEEGMDLRDYLAASALQGLLASLSPPKYDTAANVSYGYADAMLVARKK